MTTLDRLKKPKILTESDKIFSELSNELAHLKSRMNQLEQEQDDSRSLIEQISLQEELASKVIDSQQQEIGAQRENFQVIAGVMHNLKTPVEGVMENLASIIKEIDDQDTQDSLQDCINTASTVLDGFTEVEEFCLCESKEYIGTQKQVNLTSFFSDFVSKFQLESAVGRRHHLKLKTEKIPKQTFLCQETLESALRAILEELAICAEPGNVELSVELETDPAQKEVELTDLLVQVELQGGTELNMESSWVDFIKANGFRLKQSGFSLLKARNRIRQTGGQLDFIEKEGRLFGYQLRIPLTY